MSLTDPFLAPYAVDAARSPGRVHREPADPFRSGFGLDRHRIVHSAAFRRLEYKTQVFVTHEGDHYRTRLTHSIEVAHLATELARALRVNVVLAEVVALAHDLGHTPFGHAGEVVLNERMRDQGGFEHNLQSLRIVEYLEHPYPAFRGLNLMAETRECLASHATGYDRPGALAANSQPQAMPPVEGQINNVADRLAYDGHDIEDALGAGLIDESDLTGLRSWNEAAAPIRREYPSASIHAIRRPILDAMIRRAMVDVIDESRRGIRTVAPTSVDDVRSAGQIIVSASPAMQNDLAELEAFLLNRVYRHPHVAERDAHARRTVGQVFDALVAEPNLMPPRFAQRVGEQGAQKVVCDYVSGMTDRFIEAEYRRLCRSEPSSTSED
jgi:dGTPase